MIASQALKRLEIVSLIKKQYLQKTMIHASIWKWQIVVYITKIFFVIAKEEIVINKKIVAFIEKRTILLLFVIGFIKCVMSKFCLCENLPISHQRVKHRSHFSFNISLPPFEFVKISSLEFTSEIKLQPQTKKFESLNYEKNFY